MEILSWWYCIVNCSVQNLMARHSFAGGQNIAEAQEYRNYVVGKMSFEISEIIRVLQYTTYEEEGGDDPLNDMKKAASLFESNMGPAMKWVSTPTESAGGLGEVLVRVGWEVGLRPQKGGWGIGVKVRLYLGLRVQNCFCLGKVPNRVALIA